MRGISIRQAVSVVLVLCLGALVQTGQAQSLLKSGHYDLRFGFNPQEGWSYGIHDFDESTWYNPWTTVLHVTDAARRTVTPAVQFIGPVDSAFWVLPEVFESEGQENELLWLGFGAPELQRDVFTGGLGNRGRISLRLLGVSGTGIEAGGRFFMYQSDFPSPRILFSFVNGQVGGSQMLNDIVANFHAHYNWAFTVPGTYHVRFLASGELVPALGGHTTSTEVMFSFVVGEPDWSQAFPLARPVGNDWLWQADLGFIYRAGAGWYWLPMTDAWKIFPGGNQQGFWQGSFAPSANSWQWQWHLR